MFDVRLTSTLTGATPSQLRNLREKKILIPEVSSQRPPLWSFRDIMAIRSIMYLRKDFSLQAVRKVLDAIPNYLDVVDHPSEYKFGTDGLEIYVEAPQDLRAIALHKRPGNVTLFSFEEISKSFENFRGDRVAPLFEPAPHVIVNPRRMGGTPTIGNSRLTFDFAANLIHDDDYTIDDFLEDYPHIDRKALESALEFSAQVGLVKVA